MTVSTEFFPGRFRDIGLKYKMGGLTVSHIWNLHQPKRQQGIKTQLIIGVRLRYRFQ